MPRTLPTRALALAVLALLGATTAAAQGAPAPAPAVTTKITADLGFVDVSGNTEVSTFNVGEKLQQSRGRLALEQGVALVYSTQRDSVITNYLRAHLRGDYKIDKVLAAFTGVAFDRNRFAGIERRFEEVVGLAARVVGTSSDTVRIEGGGSFTQQIGTDGVQQNFPSVRGAMNWRHFFTTATYFTQNFEYVPNMKETEDWRLNSESAIVAPLSARIGLKLSYVVRYDNLPQPGFLSTDRLFTSGLQITF